MQGRTRTEKIQAVQSLALLLVNLKEVLARTSGLQLVRTLMKSPSFKPVRASAKKTSRVALCADANVQRATCSSTLKDAKFPDYLTISPGGTEAEGTSIMKVCPYTYCSLNGHHRSPVPPLKSFLSARRRSLKTQKMMKLQALSPRGAKRCNDGIKEIHLQKMLFDEDEKIAEKEAALDFFVEFYATNEEDGTEAIGRKAGVDFVGEQEVYEGPAFPNDASDEAETENYANNLVVENPSDRSPHSESESEAESFEEFPEEDQKEDADEDYGALSDQEDNSTGSCLKESDSEDLSSTEMDYSSSESIDMEWEEGQFATTVLGDYESVPNAGCSTKIQDTDKQEESLFNSDAMKGNSDNMIPDYYVLLKNDGDVSEQDVIKQNFEIQESGNEYERWSYDQLSYTDDAFKGGSELSDTDCIEISSAEEPTEKLTGTDEEIQQQNECFEAEDHEIGSHLGDVESNYTSVETDEDAVKVDNYDNGKKTEPYQQNDIAEDGNLSKGKYMKISSSNESEDQSDLRLKKSDIFGNNTGEPDNMEVENNSEPEATKNFNTANNSISPGMKRKFSDAASNFDQELPNTYNYWKRIKCKKLNMDGEEQRKFNPREPNYLPLVPDPEPEKVDLRHQIVDNKKNTDEWMLDYALQQAVTKLAPARKKKVALLVAAFETVKPAPKVGKTSTGFSHARPMQACS
nr:calmodulin binding protein PICBP-like [Malus domestica]